MSTAHRTPLVDGDREILRARAQQLAIPLAEEDAGGSRILAVEFLVATEHYLIEAEAVREVLPLRDLTPLPGAPSFVLGIMNVRGTIILVVDIRSFFELPGQHLAELNKIVVVQSGECLCGILADAITGAREVSMDGLQTALPTLTGVRAEYTKGITPERMVLLDPERIMAAVGDKLNQRPETGRMRGETDEMVS